MFIGYATKYKGYMCYHVPTQRVFVSRHVIFDEQHFPYTDLLATHSTTLASPQTHHSSHGPVPMVSSENIIVSPIPDSSHSSPSVSTPETTNIPASVSL